MLLTERIRNDLTCHPFDGARACNGPQRAHSSPVVVGGSFLGVDFGVAIRDDGYAMNDTVDLGPFSGTFWRTFASIVHRALFGPFFVVTNE